MGTRPLPVTGVTRRAFTLRQLAEGLGTTLTPTAAAPRRRCSGHGCLGIRGPGGAQRPKLSPARPPSHQTCCKHRIPGAPRAEMRSPAAGLAEPIRVRLHVHDVPASLSRPRRPAQTLVHTLSQKPHRRTRAAAEHDDARARARAPILAALIRSLPPPHSLCVSEAFSLSLTLLFFSMQVSTPLATSLSFCVSTPLRKGYRGTREGGREGGRKREGERERFMRIRGATAPLIQSGRYPEPHRCIHRFRQCRSGPAWARATDMRGASHRAASAGGVHASWRGADARLGACGRGLRHPENPCRYLF